MKQYKVEIIVQCEDDVSSELEEDLSTMLAQDKDIADNYDDGKVVVIKAEVTKVKEEWENGKTI